LYAGGTISSSDLSPIRDDGQRSTATEDKLSMRLSEAHVDPNHDMGAGIRQETNAQTPGNLSAPSKPVEAPAQPIEEKSPAPAKQITAEQIDPTVARSVKVKALATIRNGPSSSAEAIGVAQAGTTGLLVSRDSNWTQIEDPQTGRRGWVHSGLLQPPKDAMSVERLAEDSVTKTSPSKEKTKQTTQRYEARTAIAQRPKPRPRSNYVGSPFPMEFVQTARPTKKRLFKEGSLPPWDPYHF
jgi:SH3-like domain-containing protein